MREFFGCKYNCFSTVAPIRPVKTHNSSDCVIIFSITVPLTALRMGSVRGSGAYPAAFRIALTALIILAAAGDAGAISMMLVFSINAR